MFNSYHSVLKNKNFLKIWVSQLCSQFAVYMMNFVLIAQIFEKTSSTIAVSLLWIFYGLPSALIAPFSGFFVDIWSKKKILTITNLLQGIAIFCLFFAQEKIYLIYAGVFAYSALNQFYNPGEAAILPWLVKKEELPLANSLFLFTAQLSILIGLGGGSILSQIFSKNTIIFLCGSLLIIATIACSLLPQDKPFAKSKQKSATTNWKNWLEEIKNAWGFIIKESRAILLAFAMMALLQSLAASFTSILPAIAKEILNTSLTEAGPALVPPFVVGLIGGSLLFSRFSKEKRKKQWINLGVTSASLSLILISALHLLGINFQSRSIILAILLFIAGISGALILIPCQTFIQEYTPPKIRGRAFSLLGIMTNLASVIPILTVATLVDIIGVKVLLLLIGIAGILLNLFIIKKGDEIIINANNRA